MHNRFYLLRLTGTAFIAISVQANAQTVAGTTAQPELAATSVPAQDVSPTNDPAAGDPAPGDIVVTAQRRSESAQRVPISVTALDAKALEQANITSVVDLPRAAPTLRFGTTPGTVGARYVIRGIGSFGNSAIEPSVGAFLDGIYIARPASLVGTFLDMASVEVLSGPQGTLFGRNASAGALLLKTADPTGDLSGTLKAEAGTGALYKLEGNINVPLSDRVALRVAGIGSKFGGYWHNTLENKRFGGLDTYAGRVTLRSELSNRLTWTLKGDYQKLHGDGYINYQLVPSTLTPTTIANLTAFQNGIAPDLNLFDRNNNVADATSRNGDQAWGVTSDLALKIGDGYTLRLLQGYRNWRADQAEADAAGLSILTVYRNVDWSSKTHSHELQLSSPPGGLLNGRMSFITGLYYYEEQLSIRYIYNLDLSNYCTKFIRPFTPALYGPCIAGPAAGAYDTPFTQKTRSLAGYAQADVELLPKVTVTGGIRWTQDKKTGRYLATLYNPAASLFGTNEDSSLRNDEDRFTYRANLRYEPTRDLMLFATYSTGFKSGGFNSGASPTVLGDARNFGPETVKNYELGFKTQFLGRTFTVNTTVFRMDIDGYQERASTAVGGVILRNVGSLRNQGVDLQMAAAPDPHVRVDLNVAYLDSKFLDYKGAPNPPYLAGVQDLTGKRTTYAPEWAVSAGVQVGNRFGNSGLRWQLRGNVSLTSDQNLGSQIDNGPLTEQDGYALTSARLTLYGDRDRWSLAVFGNNLTDTGYCSALIYNPLDLRIGLRYPGGTAVRCTVASPRTLGVAVTRSF